VGTEVRSVGDSPDGPLAVAEDDARRSAYMRKLVRSGPGLSADSARSSRIPQVIVQFWDDADAIPADVAECMASWKPLARLGCRRKVFDDRSGRRFIAGHFGAQELAAFDQCGHPAMRCDYFRMCYVLCLGGCYVDADDVYTGADFATLFADSLLKVQPLCFDVETEQMVSPDEFLRPSEPSPHWIYYVNNNPLIAPAGHPVVRSALTRATRILLDSGARTEGIQSTTGPGNLTASLVAHDIAGRRAGRVRDFVLLPDWNRIAVSRWPLGYRADARNWRLWDPST
jgi:mannosyltransferase OCH1-like enzyme